MTAAPDVNPNGRYIAGGDGPQEVSGYFMLHTSAGDAPNRLYGSSAVWSIC